MPAPSLALPCSPLAQRLCLSCNRRPPPPPGKERAPWRIYRFHARDLHLVMGPAAPGRPVKFRVLIDGQPPGAAHGLDVDEHGIGTVTEQRLHQLIRQTGPIADRQFEIEFLDPGVEAFCFTFG